MKFFNLIFSSICVKVIGATIGYIGGSGFPGLAGLSGSLGLQGFSGFPVLQNNQFPMITLGLGTTLGKLLQEG